MISAPLFRGLQMRFALATMLALAWAHPARAELPDSVSRALVRAAIPASQVAFWMAPAAGGDPVMQHNAQQAMNPASLMKLLTTRVALDQLGPTFAWQTDVFIDGTLEKGVLNGNLVVRGSGDPLLTWDRFGALLRELRARGLDEIRGDVVLDRSLFAAIPDALFDDTPERAYNATPDALLLDFKALQMRLVPMADGTVRVEPVTPASPLVVNHTLKSNGGPCPLWRAGVRSALLPVGDGLRLQLDGNLPLACGERVLNLAVQDGPRLATMIFRQLWQELGGRWQGTAREGSVGMQAMLFASWRSPPLTEAIRGINKFSNNVMARQLFLTLGAQRGAIPATPAGGDAAVREWLFVNRLPAASLTLENGSGLSRHERASAELLGRVLQNGWQSARMPDYAASLPVAGLDGTGQRRFTGSPVAGRAYLKSGSLEDVMSIAGYVQDAQGVWQVVVFLIHHPRAGGGEAALVSAVETAAGLLPLRP